jgi:hypothetical protein
LNLLIRPEVAEAKGRPAPLDLADSALHRHPSLAVEELLMHSQNLEEVLDRPRLLV